MRHICLYTREPNFYCGQASKRVNQRKYKRSSRQPKKGDYEFRALWKHFKVSYVQIIFIFVQYSIIIVISSIFLAKLAKKKCWDPELHNCLIIVHVLVLRRIYLYICICKNWQTFVEALKCRFAGNLRPNICLDFQDSFISPPYHFRSTTKVLHVRSQPTFQFTFPIPLRQWKYISWLHASPKLFGLRACEIFTEYARNQNLSLKSVIFNLASW